MIVVPLSRLLTHFGKSSNSGSFNTFYIASLKLNNKEEYRKLDLTRIDSACEIKFSFGKKTEIRVDSGGDLLPQLVYRRG